MSAAISGLFAGIAPFPGKPGLKHRLGFTRQPEKRARNKMVARLQPALILPNCVLRARDTGTLEESSVMETWESSAIHFDGKVVRLKVGKVRLDDGSSAYREVIEHPGGVCVLPFDALHFHFVRQFRIALNQHLLEAPAGKLEPGESPETCARKELKEETGYEAATLIPLGAIFSSVGFCNERIHLFLAMDIIHSGTDPEPEERIEQVPLTLSQTCDYLRTHRFEDAKTDILARRAINYLRLQA